MENIDIDIDKDNLKNIDIDIDIDMAILENIDIDIDKGILQSIDIDKISYQLGFGISNTPMQSSATLSGGIEVGRKSADSAKAHSHQVTLNCPCPATKYSRKVDE